MTKSTLILEMEATLALAACPIAVKLLTGVCHGYCGHYALKACRFAKAVR